MLPALWTCRMPLAPCCCLQDAFFQLLEVAGCRWLLAVVCRMCSAPWSCRMPLAPCCCLQDAFSSLKLQDAVGSLLFCRMLSAPWSCRMPLAPCCCLQDAFSSLKLQDAVGSLLFCRMLSAPWTCRMPLAPCCFAGCFQLLELAGCRWLLAVVCIEVAGCRWLLAVVCRMLSAPCCFAGCRWLLVVLQDAVVSLLFCRMLSAPWSCRLPVFPSWFAAGCFQLHELAGCRLLFVAACIGFFLDFGDKHIQNWSSFSQVGWLFQHQARPRIYVFQRRICVWMCLADPASPSQSSPQEEVASLRKAEQRRLELAVQKGFWQIWVVPWVHLGSMEFGNAEVILLTIFFGDIEERITVNYRKFVNHIEIHSKPCSNVVSLG